MGYALTNQDGQNIQSPNVFKKMFLETFIPYTMGETADGMGGVTRAWVPGATFEGRLSVIVAGDRASAEQIQNDKLTVISSHKLYCLGSVALTNDMRIGLGTRRFDIKIIKNPSNLDTHLEVSLLEIDP